MQCNALYIGRKENVNWDTARSRCECFGGQLATFGNDNEWNQLKTIRNKMNTNAWIGLDDKNQEHAWKFIDGDTSYCDAHGPHVQDCDDIPQWAPGQPDNWQGNQDCAYIWPHFGGTLDDGGCAISFTYICEFPDNAFYTADTDSFPILPEPSNNNPNYYILEFTGFKDIIILISVILNVLTISCICWMMKRKSTGYSQVKMYSTEDEKL